MPVKLLTIVNPLPWKLLLKYLKLVLFKFKTQLKTQYLESPKSYNAAASDF